MFKKREPSKYSFEYENGLGRRMTNLQGVSVYFLAFEFTDNVKKVLIIIINKNRQNVKISWIA